MAGLSDSCPKCDAPITAPTLPPEEYVVETPATIEQSVAATEAPIPNPISLLPPKSIIQSSGPPITPRKKILQQDAALPFVQPPLSKPKESDLFPLFTPIVEANILDSEAPPLESPIRTPDKTSLYEDHTPPTNVSALIPLTVPDDVAPESLTTLGMGEILAEQSTSSALLHNQDVRPWLHGPYLAPARSNKILPSIFSNWLALGISFLLVDLFVFFIFRTQITEFFYGENKGATLTLDSPALIIEKPIKATPSTNINPDNSAILLKQDEPKPLAPLPMEKSASVVPAEVSAPKAVAIPLMIVQPVPLEAQSALDALKKFLEASTWNDRAIYVQNPEKIKPLMEKYASKSGDGPILVENINFIDRFTNAKGAHCTFEVNGSALPHPVMVIVEQPLNAEARVDWEAFMEFKDDLLLKFLESNGAATQKFRVKLQRIHYFDKDVPDQNNKDVFGISQPNSLFEGRIFLDKKSVLASQLNNQLPWAKDLHVIAELVWKSDNKNHWVELLSIANYGWRY